MRQQNWIFCCLAELDRQIGDEKERIRTRRTTSASSCRRSSCTASSSSRVKLLASISLTSCSPWYESRSPIEVVLDSLVGTLVLLASPPEASQQFRDSFPYESPSELRFPVSIRATLRLQRVRILLLRPDSHEPRTQEG